MKVATEIFLLDPSTGHVLLGHKKTGMGLGKVLGIGGHVDSGETPLQAIVREFSEETGAQVRPSDLVLAAEMTFRFPNKPHYSMVVHNYIATTYSGTIGETDEIKPFWIAIDEIPFDRMWDDAKRWLPRVLHGEKLRGEFVFSADNETVAHYTLQPL
ncbi:MAG: 8-oxo-dGTP diphosphatase [Candidatus Promineifilaceae bacterium]